MIHATLASVVVNACNLQLNSKTLPNHDHAATQHQTHIVVAVIVVKMENCGHHLLVDSANFFYHVVSYTFLAVRRRYFRSSDQFISKTTTIN